MSKLGEDDRELARTIRRSLELVEKSPALKKKYPQLARLLHLSRVLKQFSESSGAKKLKRQDAVKKGKVVILAQTSPRVRRKRSHR